MTVKIGLEMHFKLASSRKLFCPCKVDEKAPPNTQVCEICMGQPGTLPLLDPSALEKALIAASIFKCKPVNPVVFWRKHYTYRDLPKGYQLTTYHGVGTDGRLQLYHGYEKAGVVGITRVILEEDPAKTVKLAVDYNRCGTPLLEVVTEPTLLSAEDCVDCIKTALTSLQYAGIVAKGLKNSFRADVNISSPGCARVELKNIGSLQEIRKAVAAEVARQSLMPCDRQETRQYVQVLNTTRFMRYKESAAEYHYLPELNILPREVTVLKPIDTNYDYFEGYASNMPRSRAWAYSLDPRCNEVLRRFPASALVCRKLDLCKKYKPADYPPLGAFADNVNIADFKALLIKVAPGKALQSSLEQCLKDSAFRHCWEYPTAASRDYVIGRLIRESHKSYEDVSLFLRRTWKN